MKNVVNSFACSCILILASCNLGGTEHIAVGGWESEDHTLRIYPDMTASFDGVAASWERLDKSSIKISAEIRSISQVWEFVVVEAKLPPESKFDNSSNMEKAHSESTRSASSESQRPRGQKVVIYTGGAKPPSDFEKRVADARDDGYEYATLIVSNERIDFLRDK